MPGLIAKLLHLLKQFKVPSFQWRIFLILMLTSLIPISILGYDMTSYIDQIIGQQTAKRALQQARLIANIPGVRRALEQRQPEKMQSLISSLQQNSDASFIVVGDHQGIRYAHPDPDKIGQRMVGGDSLRALTQGMSYTSIRSGSLGLSIRGKAPVLNDSGDIIGVVSVGYLNKFVKTRINEYLVPIIMTLLYVMAFALISSFFISLFVRKQTLGMEPRVIARLLQERVAILHSLYEGYVAVDSSGLITAANPSASQSLVQDDHNLKGRNLSAFPPLEKLVSKAHERTIRDEDIRVNGQSLICNVTHYGQPGNPSGTVISFRKKDELALLTEQLTQTRQYAETLRVQGHEYANKLSVIAGMIHMGSYDRALDYIETQSRSHQEIIDFLQECIFFSKIRGLLLGKYHRSQELGINFTLDPGSRLEQLPDNVGEDHMIAIIGNLLDNAFEAVTCHIPGERQVNLLITDIGADVIIEIEDNGPGIAEDKIGEVVKKGVSSKKDIGHGIGLFLIHSLVEQNNGALLFDSARPSGAIITVCLPKKPSAAMTPI